MYICQYQITLNMIRFKHFLLIAMVAALASSCAVEELELESKEPVSGSRIVRTKSAPVVLTRRDSLRLLYEYQTRGDVFVLNHLTGSKGNFSLDLSRNDAVALGVPPEVYDFYSRFVEQLNERQK